MTETPTMTSAARLASSLAAQLASLAPLVAEPAENAGDPVGGVLRVVTSIVPGACFATITERNSRGVLRTVAATDAVAQETDTAQYRLGAGPTLDALRRGSAVVVGDLTVDARWPRFGRFVAETTSIRSVLAHPLRSAEPVAQALNLYSAEVDAFAGAASSVAALTLASTETALAGLAQRARAANLHRALMSNRRIGVAIGVLMARGQWTEDEAFGAMCEASQALNRKLRDLAEDVTLTGVLPDLPAAAADEMSAAPVGADAG